VHLCWENRHVVDGAWCLGSGPGERVDLVHRQGSC
jgi:hypothetical protein